MSFNILPNELIQRIAINLNYIDLCNLLQVNIRFNSYLSTFNDLWHQLFRKQWPTLYEEVFEPMENKKKSEINWRFETMQCHLIIVKAYNELCQMSARHHQKEELSDICFDLFRCSAVENRYYCVIDELEIIINSGNKKKHNLTIQFYARKALRSLRTDFVRKKWTKMVQELNYGKIDEGEVPVNVSPPDEHDAPGDLISGSVLIAQYCQPNITISESKIRQNIRAIALKAVKILQEKSPKNSLLTRRDRKLLTNFEASHLTNSVLEPKDCIEVIHALNGAMYEGSSRFCGNRDDYYVLTNSYIDKVLELKLGIPIMLCVLYQAAAALLGVKLYPVSNPGHFMLAIRDKPHSSNLRQQFTYIDPFNDGNLSDHPVNIFPQVVFNLSRLVIPCRPLSVFLRMASNVIFVARRTFTFEGINIMRNGLELGHLIYEEDTEMQLSLAKVYLSLDINHEQTLQLLNQQMGVVTNLVEQVNMRMTAVRPPVEIKHRPNLPEVRFAVGMVMRHRKLKYTCIIYGWDERCTESLRRIEQMGEMLLSQGENQPFYRVLADDRTTRYVAQENLDFVWNTEADIKELLHPSIGRYFIHFTGRSYELNEEMRVKYPDDECALEDIYQRHWKEM